jgi:hypothetical protein
MAVTRTSGGSFAPSLTAFAVLLAGAAVAAARLPEPARDLAQAWESEPA